MLIVRPGLFSRYEQRRREHDGCLCCASAEGFLLWPHACTHTLVSSSWEALEATPCGGKRGMKLSVRPRQPIKGMMPLNNAWLLYEGFDADGPGGVILDGVQTLGRVWHRLFLLLQDGLMLRSIVGCQSLNSVTGTSCLVLQEGSDAEELGLDEEWAASPSSHRAPVRATPRKTSR